MVWILILIILVPSLNLTAKAPEDGLLEYPWPFLLVQMAYFQGFWWLLVSGRGTSIWYVLKIQKKSKNMLGGDSEAVSQTKGGDSWGNPTWTWRLTHLKFNSWPLINCQLPKTKASLPFAAFFKGKLAVKLRGCNGRPADLALHGELIPKMASTTFGLVRWWSSLKKRPISFQLKVGDQKMWRGGGTWKKLVYMYPW